MTKMLKTPFSLNQQAYNFLLGQQAENAFTCGPKSLKQPASLPYAVVIVLRV